MSHLSFAQYTLNARTVFDFWVAHGASRAQALGWVANADAECSLDPSLVGDHGKAHGLHQWHDDRADLILKGCGVDVRTQFDLPSQLKAVAWELDHSEKRAKTHILAATTPEDAAAAICTYFERSGLGDQPAKRALRARYWAGAIGDLS